MMSVDKESLVGWGGCEIKAIHTYRPEFNVAKVEDMSYKHSRDNKGCKECSGLVPSLKTTG